MDKINKVPHVRKSDNNKKKKNSTKTALQEQCKFRVCRRRGAETHLPSEAIKLSSGARVHLRKSVIVFHWCTGRSLFFYSAFQSIAVPRLYLFSEKDILHLE